MEYIEQSKSQFTKDWIKYFLNLELPDVIVSRYANINPLDVVWQVYQICVLRHNPDNIQEFYWAITLQR